MSDVKDVGLKGRRLVAASKDWIQALSGQSQMSQPWAVTLNQNNVREGDRSCCQIPTFCPLPPPPPPLPVGFTVVHYAVVTTDTIFQIIIHLRFLF